MCNANISMVSAKAKYVRMTWPYDGAKYIVGEETASCDKSKRYIYYADDYQEGADKVAELYSYDIRTDKVDKIYSVKARSKKQDVRICIEIMDVKGGYVYFATSYYIGSGFDKKYSAIYRIKESNKKIQKLATGVDATVVGDRIYYNTDYVGYGAGMNTDINNEDMWEMHCKKIMSMKLDGKDKKKDKIFYCTPMYYDETDEDAWMRRKIGKKYKIETEYYETTKKNKLSSETFLIKPNGQKISIVKRYNKK